MSDHDPDVVRIFLDETEEYLEQMSDTLMDLEDKIENSEYDAILVDNLFRYFHSLKGSSGMMGFTRINQLTHKTENLLDKIRSRDIQLVSEHIQLFFKAVDQLKKLFEELKSGEENLDLKDIFEELQNSISGNGNSGSSQEKPSQDTSPQKEAEPLNLVNMEKYLPAFIDDTQENLSNIEEAILILDQKCTTDDYTPPQGLIDDIFRNAHAIKGASGAMGFQDINSLTHSLETLFDLVRSSKVEITPNMTSTFLEALDLLKKGLELIQSGSNPQIDTQAVLDKLDSYSHKNDKPKEKKVLEINLPEEASNQIQQLIDQKKPVYKLHVKISPKETMQGMRGFISSSRLASESPTLYCIPDMDSMGSLPELPEYYYITSTDKNPDELKQAAHVDNVEKIEIQKIESLADLKPKPAKADEPTETEKTTLTKSQNGTQPKGNTAITSQTIRVDIQRLDKLMNLSGELIINKARFIEINGKIKNVLDQKTLIHTMQTIIDDMHNLKSEYKKQGISSEKFTSLIDKILTSSDSASDHLVELKKSKKIYQDFESALHQIDLTSSELQHSVMAMRMVPVGPLFSRFKRVVRDICRDLKKDVKLKILGEETELDKKMTDELTDPLTHIVRNAVDHGVESPEERKGNGKNPQGELILNSYHKGNNICISIKDDGKGLNTKTILKKAIEKGVTTEEAAAKLTEREIHQFILHAGFSTAAKVTNISGRGVGMDIVKQKIESLNGTLEIESIQGQGTEFIINLPLTLAIQKSLMCEINGSVYALPLDHVHEIIQPDCKSVYQIQQDDVVRVREKIIPIKRFHEIFNNISVQKTTYDQNNVHFVIIGNQNHSMALPVERLIGEEDVVIKSLSQNFQNIDGISGATILGNGNIALIIDVASILESIDAKARANGGEIQC